MALDINSQKPFNNKNVSTQKPNIPKTATPLSGYIATSMNGGFNKTIAWKQVMAGEKHYEYRLKANIKMLTPLTPAYQNLKMTIRSYFVPNSRVWTNAEKYTAQKGGSAEIKIKEIPNIGGATIPYILDMNTNKVTSLVNTTRWRDSFVSSYIPRVGEFETDEDGDSVLYTMPKYNLLKIRGRIAIWNDYERNKEYQEEIYEYKDDTMSQNEWERMMPMFASENEIFNFRAKKDNSYYSDYRTDIQGFESELPEPSADKSLISWSAWESKIAEARSQAEMANWTDWAVIAKIRGSKLLTEGKVQLIGEKTFNLNYAAITQNAYNNNSEINENFRVLGQQGAYSFTEVNIPLYAGMEFNEEGYVHVIATVTADTVYEKGFDRNELNVTPLDQYRPDLKDDKYDVLYEIETDTTSPESTSVIGFKRKYTELFKLPNIISGDMTTDNYYESDFSNVDITKQVETNKTFTFFEKNRNTTLLPDGTVIYKKPYLDYTDLQINKNQAIQNEIEVIRNENGFSDINIKGQNQIFMLGVCSCIAELPVDEAIKENYTTWGEH